MLLAPGALAAATPITAGTDLSTVLNSSGEYELQAGTHTISTGFTMATGVTLTFADGAALLIAANQTQIFDDTFVMRGGYIQMASGSRLRANAVSGNTFVQDSIIEDNTFVPSGTITTAPYIWFGQGFNTYHRNNLVKDNDFFGIVILEEVGDNIDYIGNAWHDTANLRPLQFWGSNHEVRGNYINGGTFGIDILGKHNIAAARRPCTGNVISSNVVLNTSEEGIGIDAVGNVAAETVLREYDTVASKPGGSVINLASVNWVAQTTYTGSVYDAVFTDGALAGRRYKITTHSGAAFTLSGLDTDYASVNVGDGVSVQLACYGNTIANNVVLPTLTASRRDTSGIALHGIGQENLIVNNVTAGYTDGVGAGSDWYTYFGIIENNLNGITATDSITGNQRRGPVGRNTITDNFVIAGSLGQHYKDYGSNPDYDPPASTYSNNTDGGDPKFVGGSNPSTLWGVAPAAGSPLVGTGIDVAGVTLDVFGDTFYSLRDRGAVRRDQCYRRDAAGNLSKARFKSQVISRCNGVPGRYPEGM